MHRKNPLASLRSLPYCFVNQRLTTDYWAILSEAWIDHEALSHRTKELRCVLNLAVFADYQSQANQMLISAHDQAGGLSEPCRALARNGSTHRRLALRFAG